MSYSKYPQQIDSESELPISEDNVTLIDAELINRLRDAVIAVESTLGVNPQGVYGTVRDRLDNISSNGGGGGSVVLQGDVVGEASNNTVTKIRNIPVDEIVPENDDVIYYNSVEEKFEVGKAKTTANNISYNNSDSGLESTDLQSAVDELARRGPGNVDYTCTMILRPGRTPGGNVYTSWEDVLDAVPKDGLVTILLDGDITLPEGEWDLEGRIALAGYPSSSRSLLPIWNKITLPGNVVVKNPYSIEHLVLQGEGGYFEFDEGTYELWMTDVQVYCPSSTSVFHVPSNVAVVAIVNGRTYDSYLDSNTFDVDGHLDIRFYGGVRFLNDTVKETWIANYHVMSSAVRVPRQWREDGFPANAIRYCDAHNIYLSPGDTDLPDNVRDALWELASRPVVRDAEDIAYDPSSSGLAATDVQDALDELATRPSGSDATKIQGTDVSTDPILTGQTYVKSSSGVLVPRYVSPSSDRLITVAGTYTVELGENVYVDVAVGDTELKAPASPPVGATFRVKRLSTNANLVVVDGNGATIDGDSAVSIKPGEAALFRCYAAGKWARLGKCEAVSQGVVAHLGLDYDPIALWKLDGTLNDYSGNGYNFTNTTGTIGYVTPTADFKCALVAGSIQASGSLSGLLMLDDIDDMTIQAVVCLQPSTADLNIFRNWVNGGGNNSPNFRLVCTSTATAFSWRNTTNTATVTVSGPATPRGEWVHLAATRRAIDGKMLARIYINGTKVAEVGDLDMPTHHTSSGRGIIISESVSGAGSLLGMIGSVKINDFALTDEQVYAEAQRAKRAP